MQIHELNNYSGELNSGAYTVVDNGSDTGKISVPALLQSVQNEIDDANARIDNIVTSPAPSAEEVTDGRFGFNGITYASLGAAIRGQFSDVNDEIDNINNMLMDTVVIKKTGSYTIPASNVLNTSSNPLMIAIPSGTTYRFILTSDDVADGVRYTINELDASKTNIGWHNAYVGSASSATTSGEVKYITLYSNQPGLSENDVLNLEVSFENGGGGSNSIEYKVNELSKLELIDSANLLKQSEIVDNEYLDLYGSAHSDNGYCHTPKLPVNPGDIIQSNISPVRFVTFYNSSGAALNASGLTSADVPITVPAGAYYVALSVSYNYKFSTYWMVSIGSDIEPYQDGNDAALNYEDISGLNSQRFESSLGNNSVKSELGALTANTTYSLSTAPRFSRKGVDLSFFCKISSFTGLTIGKGYRKMNGKGIRIDGTKIVLHLYNENQDITGASVDHGLTIDDYLAVIMSMNVSGVCTVTINTTSGTFTTDLDFNYLFADQPFIIPEQNGTDAVFSCTTNDLKCPMWFMGDSYLMFNSDRIMGQLKTLGFTDNVMIDAYPGLKAWDGPNNESAVREAQRVLALASPKYLVWCLGMNGAEGSSLLALNWIEHICADRGIELILYTVPSVPGLAHETLNAAIKASGYRYIDGYDAVGSQVGGTWYDGYLSDDNVHPTELGAQALAARFLVDLPEIMQYK